MSDKPPSNPPIITSPFHSALGLCLANWQRVEEFSFMIFWRLSLYQYAKWSALIFTQIRAFDQRCVLMDNIANATLEGTAELKQWELILDKLTKAGKKRHKLVHYSIDLTDEMEWRVQPQMFGEVLDSLENR